MKVFGPKVFLVSRFDVNFVIIFYWCSSEHWLPKNNNFPSHNKPGKCNPPLSLLTRKQLLFGGNNDSPKNSTSRWNGQVSSMFTFCFQAVSLICVPKVTLSFFSSKLYCFSVLNAKIVFSVSYIWRTIKFFLEFGFKSYKDDLSFRWNRSRTLKQFWIIASIII